MNDFVDAFHEWFEDRKITELSMWTDLVTEVENANENNKSVATLALKTQSDMQDATRIAAHISKMFKGLVEATVTQNNNVIMIGFGANELNQNHSGYLTLKLL